MPRKNDRSKTSPRAKISSDHVQQRIYLIRAQRVITDADLAALYGATTKRLNQQVRRNEDRFPNDFMFQLTSAEAESLRLQIATLNAVDITQTPENAAKSPFSSRSQFATLNNPDSRSQIATLNDPILRSQIATLKGRGSNLKYRPLVFTEHGAIMAATVLNSPQAVKASLFVVRAFVKLREMFLAHRDFAAKLDELERKFQGHDEDIQTLFRAIHELMEEPEEPKKPPIGIHTEIAAPRQLKKSRPRHQFG